MNKSRKTFTISLASVVLVALVSLFFSCEVGLGSAVDTQSPVLSIETPSSSTIHNRNILVGGTWNDDKGVTRVELSVSDNETSNVVLNTVNAELLENKRWGYELYSLISEDAQEGKILPDGKYTVDVTAYDAAGHSSGKASRTFEVDSTPPVVVLSKPNSMTVSSPARYGRKVQIKGVISDDHSVTKMTVRVFKEDGTEIQLAKSEFSGFDTSDTSVTIAEYLNPQDAQELEENSDEWKVYQNYVNIYGDSSSENFDKVQNYYILITTTDNAGNVSDKAYIKTYLTNIIKTVTNLTSAPETNELKSILNGSYSGKLTEKQISQIKSILKGTIYSETDENYNDALEVIEYFSTGNEDSEFENSKLLAFSINSKANPTYEILNYKYDSSDSDTWVGASKDASLNIKVASGLDGASIYPYTIEAKITKVNISGSVVTDENGNPAKEIIVTGDKIYESSSPSNTVNEIYTPVDTATYSISLSDFKDELEAAQYYKIEVFGKDENENDFAPVSDSSGNSYTYGFQVETTQNAAELSFENDKAYVKAASVADGTLPVNITVTDDVDSVLKVSAYVKVYDTIVTSVGTEAIENNGIKVLDAVVKEDDSSYTINIPLNETGSNGVDFAGHIASAGEGNYTIAVRIIVEKEGANSAAKTYYIYADNAAPKIEITNGKFVEAEKIGENEYKVGAITESDSNYSISGNYTVRGKWSDVNGAGTKKIWYTFSTGTSSKPLFDKTDASFSADGSSFTDKNGIVWQSIPASEASSVTTEAQWSHEFEVGQCTEENFYYVAEDDVGNCTPVYAYTQMSFDYAVPTVSLSSPAKVNSYFKKGDSVQFVIQAQDSHGISNVNKTSSTDGINVVVKKNGVTVSSGTNGYTLSEITLSNFDSTTGIPKTASRTVTLNSSGSNDGKWTVEALAKDVTGRETSADGKLSFSTIVDGSVPVYYEGSEATSDAEKKLTVGGKVYSDSAYYKDTTLRISGYYTDTTSGINTVYYYVDYPGRSGTVSSDLSASNDGEVAVSSTGGVANFTITPSNFVENKGSNANTLYIQAKDNAGNLSVPKAITINLDQTTPDFSSAYYTCDGTNFTSASGSVLTNKTSPIYVYGTISDSASGAGEITFTRDGVTVTPTVTYSEAEINTTNTESASNFSSWARENASTFKAYSSIDEKTKITTWKAVFDTTAIGSGGKIKATPSDVSGNGSPQQIFTLTVDTANPTIVYNGATDETTGTTRSVLNGTVYLSGTADDNNQLTSVSDLEYSVYNTTNSSWGSWTQVTSGGNKVAVEGTYSWKSGAFDTAELFPDSKTKELKVRFRVKASDTAGNSGYTTSGGNYFETTVNQNKDRPEIRFSTVTLVENGKPMSDSNYVWLKNSTSLLGTISDDDGIEKFEIRVDGSVWQEIPCDTSWSFDLTTLYSGTDKEKQKEANGPKVIEFRVTDKCGKVFTSKPTAENDSVYLVDGKNVLGDETNSSYGTNILYITVDTLSPEVQIPAIYDSKSTAEDEVSKWISTAGFKIGGDISSFKIKATASDANGIKSISATADFGGLDIDGTVECYDSSDVKIPSGYDGLSYCIITFDLSSYLSELSTFSSSVSLSVTAEDTAGNKQASTATISADYKKPEISVTGPNSSQYSSGSVTAYGTVDSSSTLYFAVSTSDSAAPGTSVSKYYDEDGTSHNTKSSVNIEDYNQITDASLSWFIYFDGELDNSTGTHVKTLNKYLIDYKIASLKSDATSDDDIELGFETIVKLYLWIKAVDEAGNESVSKHAILVDPQGDRPTVEIAYPEETGTTLGGTVTLRGSASDPNGSVQDVWVQIISEKEHSSLSNILEYTTVDGKITSDSVITTFVPSSADVNLWITNGYSVYYIANSDAIQITSSNYSSYTAKDCYIKANFSGSSWNLPINKKEEFNPAKNTTSNPVAYRVFSRDNDNKFSRYAQQIVKFDSDNPVISNLYLMQYTDNDNGTGTVTASRTYTSDMWIRGTWWITGTASDTDLIASLEINKEEQVTTAAQEVNFKYKLDTGTGVGNLGSEFKIVASDSAGHTQTEYISINYDNQSPTLVGADDSSYALSPLVQNDNGFYTLRAKVSEPAVSAKSQSGLDFVAFYFMRRNNILSPEIDTIYNPMVIRSNSAAAQVSSSTTKIGAASETDVVYDSGLYWLKKTVTRTSSNTNVVVMDAEDSSVMAGGLVKLNGTNYLISSVNGATVTIDGTPLYDSSDASVTETVYFALALVVNNTTSENGSGLLNEAGYYNTISNSDGDGIVEEVKKSGTDYTWEANIVSKNIPDGPIELHYIAFDKAGNYSIGIMGNMTESNFRSSSSFQTTPDRTEYKSLYSNSNRTSNILYVDGVKSYLNGTSSVIKNTDYRTAAFVSNNAPRLAGFVAGIDSDGNNAISDDEKVTTDVNGDKTTGKYSTYESSVTTMSVTTGLVTKGKTVFYPEILGGNGDLYWKYSIVKDGASSDYYADTNLNDYSSSEGLVYSVYDFLSAGTTGSEIADGGQTFKFTFIDSTEGVAKGSGQKAYLNVNIEVALRDTIKPTNKIIPFYWKSSADNSLFGESKENGHIELEGDWKNSSGYAYYQTKTSGYESYYNNAEFDEDPKVSGKIKIEGIAWDNKLLKTLSLTIPGFNSGNAFNIASYNTASSSWTVGSALEDGNIPDVGYAAKIERATYGEMLNAGLITEEKLTALIDESNEETLDTVKAKLVKYITQEYGHIVKWTVYFDTSKIGVKTNIVLSAAASDIGSPAKSGSNVVYTSNTSASDSSYTKENANTSLYRVDAVPYVVKVETNLSKKKNSNWSVYNRSALGHYPVQTVATNVGSGVLNTTTSEDVTLHGFNLYSSSIVIKDKNGSNLTGITNTEQTSSDLSKIKFNVASIDSGEMNVSVDSLVIINNFNNNNAMGSASESGTANVNKYNMQANGDTNNILTDDLVFDVWEFNDRAAVPINGLATGVQMQVNQNSKMLNFAFANGGVYYSMGNNEYSSQYWCADYDTFAGPCVGFHVDDFGYTYSVASGGDTNTSGSIDKYVLYSGRWGPLDKNYYGTLNGNKSLRLEEIALRLGSDVMNYSLMKYRYLSSEMASSTKTLNGKKTTNLYFVNYDALTDEIRFRAGTFNTTSKQESYGFQDEYENATASYYSTNNCQVIANNSTSGGSFIRDSNGNKTTVPLISRRGAGQYVDVAVAKNGTTDVACVVWFDAYENCLKYTYYVDPISNWNNLKGNRTASGWSPPVPIFAEGGEYCQIAVDKNNHIHIAAYAGNGDVKYAYLEEYDSSYREKTNSCTVDASGAVGEHLTLDVALDSSGNSIPYIGYFTSAIKAPKYAYLVDTTNANHVPAGADENERFTGAWEVTVIPTPNRLTTNREDKINIGVFKTSGGVLNYSTTDGEAPGSTNIGTSYSTSTSAGYGDSREYSKCYGNGSKNAVFAYQISGGTGSCIEVAQMR